MGSVPSAEGRLRKAPPGTCASAGPPRPTPRAGRATAVLILGLQRQLRATGLNRRHLARFAAAAADAVRAAAATAALVGGLRQQLRDADVAAAHQAMARATLAAEKDALAGEVAALTVQQAALAEANGTLTTANATLTEETTTLAGQMEALGLENAELKRQVGRGGAAAAAPPVTGVLGLAAAASISFVVPCNYAVLPEVPTDARLFTTLPASIGGHTGGLALPPAELAAAAADALVTVLEGGGVAVAVAGDGLRHPTAAAFAFGNSDASRAARQLAAAVLAGAYNDAAAARAPLELSFRASDDGYTVVEGPPAAVWALQGVLAASAADTKEEDVLKEVLRAGLLPAFKLKGAGKKGARRRLTALPRDLPPFTLSVEWPAAAPAAPVG